ncbi:MAG: hypothetical protein IJ439_01975 [Tyzzerella sp.]|nr:hypothetical protein [Tyzzerella sp.]
MERRSSKFDREVSDLEPFLFIFCEMFGFEGEAYLVEKIEKNTTFRINKNIKNKC